MRVSFDLDETLIRRGSVDERENGWLTRALRPWHAEPLRRGTRTLFRELRRLDCSIWIYTTSERTSWQIRWWLIRHGIRVDGIVNGGRHRRALAGRTFARLPSKYPPAFDINLHVDDSEGVRMEGKQHGFRVLVVQPNDADWAAKVLSALKPSQ